MKLREKDMFNGAVVLHMGMEVLPYSMSGEKRHFKGGG